MNDALAGHSRQLRQPINQLVVDQIDRYRPVLFRFGHVAFSNFLKYRLVGVKMQAEISNFLNNSLSNGRYDTYVSSPTQTFQVSLSDTALKQLRAAAAERNMSLKGLMSALVEYFAALDRTAQAVVLGQVDAADLPAIRSALIARGATPPPEAYAATSPAAEALRSKVSESIVQTRKRRRSLA